MFCPQHSALNIAFLVLFIDYYPITFACNSSAPFAIALAKALPDSCSITLACRRDTVCTHVVVRLICSITLPCTALPCLFQLCPGLLRQWLDLAPGTACSEWSVATPCSTGRVRTALNWEGFGAVAEHVVASLMLCERNVCCRLCSF